MSKDVTAPISFAEAARVISVSRSTIGRWSRRGVGGIRLAHVRRGGRLFTSLLELDRFLTRCRANRWAGIEDRVAATAEQLLAEKLGMQESPPDIAS